MFFIERYEKDTITLLGDNSIISNFAYFGTISIHTRHHSEVDLSEFTPLKDEDNECGGYLFQGNNIVSNYGCPIYS